MNTQKVQADDNRSISSNEQQNDIGIYDLLGILFNHKVYIIITILVFTFLALGYAFYTPNLYRASAYILPPSRSDISGLNRLAKYDIFKLNEQGLNRQDKNKQEKEFFTSVDIFKEYLLNLNSLIL